jgi:hypothetical protein
MKGERGEIQRAIAAYHKDAVIPARRFGFSLQRLRQAVKQVQLDAAKPSAAETREEARR